jgi:hypothetical protein
MAVYASYANAMADIDPPSVDVPDAENSPTKKITSDQLRQLGSNLSHLFAQYASDRKMLEYRWLRNQRQYLGIYDPEVEGKMSDKRSKAYPKLTRVKCISVLARLMNLMFPGNERNWELKATPVPDMSMDEVNEAIAAAQQKDQEAGVPKSNMSPDWLEAAMNEYMSGRVEKLSKLIDDQLMELGGDQTNDYVAINRAVIRSGIIYGLGIAIGPYVKETKSIQVVIDAKGQPSLKRKTTYKPMFEFVPIWDFYPDMSAKTFDSMDGNFIRRVMSRSQVAKLRSRSDFFDDQITEYLARVPQGNYKPATHEQELRAMGVKANVNEMKTETMKYEVIIWRGAVSGEYLLMAGCEIPRDKIADDFDAEIWMIDGNVIKATLNPWRELGCDLKTTHVFLFDEDDTSLAGFGLPNAIRDSQMAVSAASRMLLDNASVICGPQVELNMDLLVPDQDFALIEAYKVWYRNGLDISAQSPAVRNVEINSHIPELISIIELFTKFADAETFVGPATGGDMEKAPSEPMRTAAGASMLRGDAALPFKDVVRAFDRTTQSMIDAMVKFNRKLNPDLAPDGDYDVVARGATSLIAKEVRGANADQLAQTLTDDERIYVDHKKFAKARFEARDLNDCLLSDEDADRALQAQSQKQAEADAQQKEMIEAEIRKTLADAFKNIAQGQKNISLADVQTIKGAMELLEQGLTNVGANTQTSDGSGQAALPAPADNGGDPAAGPSAPAAGADQGGTDGQLS